MPVPIAFICEADYPKEVHHPKSKTLLHHLDIQHECVVNDALHHRKNTS
jgi:hypothetical protein